MLGYGSDVVAKCRGNAALRLLDGLCHIIAYVPPNIRLNAVLFPVENKYGLLILLLFLVCFLSFPTPTRTRSTTKSFRKLDKSLRISSTTFMISSTEDLLPKAFHNYYQHKSAMHWHIPAECDFVLGWQYKGTSSHL